MDFGCLTEYSVGFFGIALGLLQYSARFRVRLPYAGHGLHFRHGRSGDGTRVLVLVILRDLDLHPGVRRRQAPPVHGGSALHRLSAGRFGKVALSSRAQVIKRDGTSCPVQFDKISARLQPLCEGLSDVIDPVRESAAW